MALPADHAPRALPALDFVRLARSIVEQRGLPRRSAMQPDGLEYSDNLVRIRTRYNGLDIEVERRPIRDDRYPELAVSNPTTMVRDGIVIRHHGEHCHLVPHLEALSQEIDRCA